MGSLISNCPHCKKSFGLLRWRWQCIECGITLCSDCLKKTPEFENLVWKIFPDGKLCKGCYEKLAIPAIGNYKNALNQFQNVAVYSANYRGRIKTLPGSEKERISSDYYEDKGEAEHSLKLSAAYLGCNILFNVTWDKKTEQETTSNGKGTHYYSVWSISGIPAKSDKN